MSKPSNANQFFDDNGDVGTIRDTTGGSHASPKQRRDGGRAFLSDPYDGGRSTSEDAVAEELGGQAIAAAMSGGADVALEELDAETEEERGGPFVDEPEEREYAGDDDESNPRSAVREAMPSPMRATQELANGQRRVG